MKNQLAIGLALALALPVASQAQSMHNAVVAAETAYITMAAKTNTQAAFLAHSAPTALVTEQGKWTNAQEGWKSRPAQPGKTLAWYPVLADAAQTGDLGYTTGPWTSFQNTKPQANGEYVSVWRKQLDGTLKVVVDMSIERVGVAQPKPTSVPQPRLLPAVAVPSRAPSNIVLDVDRKFAAAQMLKPGATYQQYLSSEARLYRPGLSMMQGAAASANMKNIDGGYLFTVVDGYLAAAGDLGYVVGTLRRPGTAKRSEENGTYLRIWRREAVDGWRVVLEIFNLAPNAATVTSTAPTTTEEARVAPNISQRK